MDSDFVNFLLESPTNEGHEATSNTKSDSCAARLRFASTTKLSHVKIPLLKTVLIVNAMAALELAPNALDSQLLPTSGTEFAVASPCDGLTGSEPETNTSQMETAAAETRPRKPRRRPSVYRCDSIEDSVDPPSHDTHEAEVASVEDFDFNADALRSPPRDASSHPLAHSTDATREEHTLSKSPSRCRTLKSEFERAYSAACLAEDDDPARRAQAWEGSDSESSDGDEWDVRQRRVWRGKEAGVVRLGDAVDRACSPKRRRFCVGVPLLV